MQSVFYGLGLDYDGGADPSVAVNKRGTILEVHKLGFTLYSRVGRPNQMTVIWGPTAEYTSGITPNCAINNNDVAIEVHKNEAGTTVYAMVGIVSGTSVSWGKSKDYDSGKTPDVAINDSNKAVEVHKTQNPFSDGLYCSVGTVNTTDKSVKFGSSSRFADGDYPKVAMNNGGTVVTVYNGADPKTELRYRVGTLSGSEVKFGTSYAFGKGSQADVAIADDGMVVVSFKDGVNLYQRVGRITGTAISWEGPQLYYDDGSYPSVSIAGNLSVEAHEGELLKRLWYSTSLVADRSSWMQLRQPTLGNKQLRQLALSASHDAGMYAYGIAVLGKTQDLTIHGQLADGIRWFDIRPDYDSGNGKFYVVHNFIRGPELTELLNDMRRFAQEGHRELAIVKLSHFRNFDNSIYQKMTELIRSYVGPYCYTTLPAGKRLADVTLSEYIASGMKFLFVVDEDYAIDRPAPGFWVYRDWESETAAKGDLRVYDIYANKMSWTQMRDDQFRKFREYNGKCELDPNLPCDMFLLSWTVTPPTGVWFDSKDANRHLGISITELPNPNSFGQIVNMVYCDYVEFSRNTDVALVMNGERVSAEALLSPIVYDEEQPTQPFLSS